MSRPALAVASASALILSALAIGALTPARGDNLPGQVQSGPVDANQTWEHRPQYPYSSVQGTDNGDGTATYRVFRGEEPASSVLTVTGAFDGQGLTPVADSVDLYSTTSHASGTTTFSVYDVTASPAITVFHETFPCGDAIPSPAESSNDRFLIVAFTCTVPGSSPSNIELFLRVLDVGTGATLHSADIPDIDWQYDWSNYGDRPQGADSDLYSVFWSDDGDEAYYAYRLGDYPAQPRHTIAMDLETGTFTDYVSGSDTGSGSGQGEDIAGFSPCGTELVTYGNEVTGYTETRSVLRLRSVAAPVPALASYDISSTTDGTSTWFPGVDQIRVDADGVYSARLNTTGLPRVDLFTHATPCDSHSVPPQPQWPAGLAVGHTHVYPLDADGRTLSWPAATDDVAVTGYQVNEWNGTVWRAITSAPANATSVALPASYTETGVHTFSVFAVDGQGRRSVCYLIQGEVGTGPSPSPSPTPSPTPSSTPSSTPSTTPSGTPSSTPTSSPTSSPTSPTPDPTRVRPGKPQMTWLRKPAHDHRGRALLGVPGVAGHPLPTGAVRLVLVHRGTTKVLTAHLPGHPRVRVPKLARGTWHWQVRYAGDPAYKPRTGPWHDLRVR